MVKNAISRGSRPKGRYSNMLSEMMSSNASEARRDFLAAGDEDGPTVNKFCDEAFQSLKQSYLQSPPPVHKMRLEASKDKSYQEIQGEPWQNQS